MYNLSGKQVASLADRTFSVGTHIVHWNIKAIGSGTYWIVFEAGGKQVKEKIVIAR